MGTEAVLAVGDPRRPRVWLAVRATFLAAVLFTLTAAPVKQWHVLYAHSPWVNDPYDTVVSFMMFFVPLVAALGLVRVWLCRTSEALPLERVRDIVHACVVVLIGITATSLAEWAAVGLRANGAQWDEATLLQVALLALVTASIVPAAIALRRVRLPVATTPPSPGVDWLSDLLAIARRESGWLGPFRGFSLRVLALVEHGIVPRVRRHPLWSAGVACAAFGVGVGINQALREGYDPGSALLVVVLLTCGTFCLLLCAGSYLGLVRAPVRLAGVRRRAVDAFVATIAIGLCAFAFRDHLWWLVDSTAAQATTGQLTLLLTGVCVPSFLLALGLESALRLHGAGPEGG